ncbi:hypothetical protein KsCSTR_11800 [Candidatus Kuenenia stuttgartiensis]|uniref:Uncharacterized protein n=1 Tax=Kuenenia stuttgartiensis TaxID=174633 RepID=Q1PYC3_KUEST|nr:hypothetical protein KsCSTR_11800 [Candidatus Kuenenia stuttgartiensis]CAJ72087.1 unknown protein [Candidatus Kuenenia stuttgartiensis]
MPCNCEAKSNNNDAIEWWIHYRLIHHIFEFFYKMLRLSLFGTKYHIICNTLVGAEHLPVWV